MRSVVFCWTLSILFIGYRSAVSAPPEIPIGIHNALQDRRYDDALRAVDVALKDPKAKLPDYLLYLRARTLHFQKKYAAAVKQFDVLAKLHPNSQWSRQARLAKGVSLAKDGKFKEAAVAYQREAKFLVSAARRRTIAGIYLELADAHFAPKRVGVKPNFTIARQFYLKAIEIGPQLEKMRDVRMRIAQCSQKLGQFAVAAQQYEEFLKKFPQDQLTVEARFQLGDSYASASSNSAARRAWGDLLRLHLNSKSPRIAEAAFRIGLTYGLPNPNSELNLARGVASLRQFLKRFSKHKLASRAYVSIAESYQNSGRFSEAAAVLQDYLKNEAYAADPEYPEARLLLGFAYGRQEKFQLAINVWKQFLTNHPTHKLWQTAQTEIINAKYLRADLFSRQKKYRQAKKLWDDFLAEYPIDTAIGPSCIDSAIWSTSRNGTREPSPCGKCWWASIPPAMRPIGHSS